MGIFWRPRGGNWQGGGPVGFGELYNSATKLIRKGCFSGSALTDPNGQLIDYNSGAVIYQGAFINDKKTGPFTVYTIAPDIWSLVQPGVETTVSCTKKNVVYADDIPGADQNVETTNITVYFCVNSTGCLTTHRISD